MGQCGRNTAKRGRLLPQSALVLLALLNFCHGVEHNLPDNVELVDPKDLGLDSQFDLDKLLGNVKALPIDTNSLSSALGKPGLKTQVLTVGFDGSEGLNLDDFELPQLKNDEHGPLAQEAFKSFKNFFRNSSMATAVQDAPTQAPVQFSRPVQGSSPRPGGKRRTMMKRRKVVRVNGTTTTPPPPPSEIEPQASSSGGPKVIELDSSQIEKLIASGKIGPPKSLTPGGPQVIELGQSDLDALLNSENGDEIKQILEGGDTIQNFDLSQLSGSGVTQNKPQEYQTSTRQAEASTPPVSQQPQQQTVTSPLPTASSSIYQTTSLSPTTVESSETIPPLASVSTTTLAPSSSSDNTQPPAPSTTTGLPIIYQYNSLQDSKNNIPPQGIQGAIPLQFYSSHANGHQQARLVKTPTFEFISAPPVSFSSSVLPTQNNVNSNNQNQPALQQQIQQQQQQHQQPQFQFQPQTLFIQPQPQFQHQFIALSQPQQNFQQSPQQQFVPGPPPPVQQQTRQEQSQSLPVSSTTKQQLKKESSLNKIIPAAQTSQHTEEVKFKSASNSNYISSLHKVNLPLNSVKLVTPSPQTVQSVLNQVPDSFQPSIAPNHVVSSPVLDPIRVGNFLRSPQQQTQSFNAAPFRNTNFFSNSLVSSAQRSPSPAIRTHPSALVRFPSPSTTSAILNSSPNRFRVAESQNPFFTFRPSATGGFGNLVLNSFVAGDGLNYRARSSDGYNAPGL